MYTHRFNDDLGSSSSKAQLLPCSPSQNFTVDAISKALNYLHPSDVFKPTYIKGHHYTKSQSRLDIPTTVKFQASPKCFNTEIKTDRQNPKLYGQENIEVSCFDIAKPMKVENYTPFKAQDYTLKILTPSNRVE